MLGNLAPIARALVRNVRSFRAVSYVVLSTINTLASKRPSLFSAYAKDFFIFPTDPLFLKALKIDTLALIATPETAPLILAELQVCHLYTYIYQSYILVIYISHHLLSYIAIFDFCVFNMTYSLDIIAFSLHMYLLLLTPLPLLSLSPFLFSPPSPFFPSGLPS